LDAASAKYGGRIERASAAIAAPPALGL